MQVLPTQVVIQLSSAPGAGGSGAPVFSVSRAPSAPGASSNVQISAAARALAEASGMAVRPQLNLFVQYVGAFGGSGRSFTPISPAAVAAERAQIDAGGEARAAAAADALAREAAAEQRAVVAASAEQAPPPAATTAPARPSAPVASYQQAAPAAEAPAPSVNVSV